MVKFRRSPPPLSSGPGRGPLKAETRVRTSLGALHPPSQAGFFFPGPLIPVEGTRGRNTSSNLVGGTSPAISGGFFYPRPSHPRGGDPRPKHEFEPRWGHFTRHLRRVFISPALSSPWRGPEAETRVRTSLGALHPPSQAGFYFPGPLIPVEGTRGRNTSSNLVGGTSPAISGGFLFPRPSHPRGGDPRPKHEFEPRWGHFTRHLRRVFLSPALSSPWRGPEAETRVRTSLGALHPPSQAGFFIPGPLKVET